MRKMIRLVHDDDRKLLDQINETFQKLENAGYLIISTQIVKSTHTKFIAFIEYDTTQQKK